MRTAAPVRAGSLPMMRDPVVRFAVTATLVALAIQLFYVVLAWLGQAGMLEALGREDGPVEWATVVLWAAGSGLCLVRLARGQSRARGWLLFWMVLTFVFMGEEASWFQRVLGFGTPEAIAQSNYQGEFNVHNLDILSIGALNPQNLFRAGFFTYFLILPLLMQVRRIRELGTRLGYVAPEAAFLLMVWSVLGVSVVLSIAGPDSARRAVVETQEGFQAFVVLSYVFFYLGPVARRRPSEASGSRA
jgi:hypothetical protein